jgi:hypothetical protein
MPSRQASLYVDCASKWFTGVTVQQFALPRPECARPAPEVQHVLSAESATRVGPRPMLCRLLGRLLKPFQPLTIHTVSRSSAISLRRFEPKPLVATTVEDILKAKGVKPCLSPNLNVLATIEALQVKKLLFIGVGCQVQALRAVEQYLPCEKLYVLGTNCVDNGPRKGLDKFLKTASDDPETVLHYEFMQARPVDLMCSLRGCTV